MNINDAIQKFVKDAPSWESRDADFDGEAWGVFSSEDRAELVLRLEEAGIPVESSWEETPDASVGLWAQSGAWIISQSTVE